MKLHPVLQEIAVQEAELLPSDSTFKELAELEADSPKLISATGDLPCCIVLRSIAGSPSVRLQRDRVSYSLQGISPNGIAELILTIGGGMYTAWVSSALVQIERVQAAD